MRTETFSLVGIDPEDCEAFELRWNNWVRDLFARGFRPGEEPVAWTDTQVEYVIHPLGGVNDFNREHVENALSGAA